MQGPDTSLSNVELSTIFMAESNTCAPSGLWDSIDNIMKPQDQDDKLLNCDSRSSCEPSATTKGLSCLFKKGDFAEITEMG